MYFFKKRDSEDFLRFRSVGKMALTWGEFLNLAAVVQNLLLSMKYFDDKKIDIKELNRRVFETAQNYFDFLRDARYIEFIQYIRVS